MGISSRKGLVVAGLGGGSGKSVVAVGLAAAFARRQHRVVPFKKGPDYIDAGWLAMAAGNDCYNLDPYLMAPEVMLASFQRHSCTGDTIIVEGNRGLYDGVDLKGSYSTAELAKTIKLPVLLVVDCTKVTRTVAAMVLGCVKFDKDVDIRGVVLNRIGSARHGDIVRRSIEEYTGIPVLGTIARSKDDVFPQRHLGVTPCQEHSGAGAALASLADKISANLDLAGIEALMAEVDVYDRAVDMPTQSSEIKKVRVGVIKDAAFQFYYSENIIALQEVGAEIIEINAMQDKMLPDIDALYIGGGFPETSAKELSANSSFRKSVNEAADAGLPIYAECGGLIYLGESMELDGEIFPLAGVFPVRYGLAKKPQAHGYTVLSAGGNNPYYREGVEIRGHEFRYSTILKWGGKSSELAFKMTRGTGFMDGRDGLVYKNVLALYTHIHALGTPEWAVALVDKGREKANEDLMVTVSAQVTK